MDGERLADVTSYIRIASGLHIVGKHPPVRHTHSELYCGFILKCRHLHYLEQSRVAFLVSVPDEEAPLFVFVKGKERSNRSLPSFYLRSRAISSFRKLPVFIQKSKARNVALFSSVKRGDYSLPYEISGALCFCQNPTQEVSSLSHQHPPWLSRLNRRPRT